MLIGQSQELTLFPDTGEVAWALMAGFMLVLIATAIVSLLVWAKQAAKRRELLEARVTDLEQELLEKPTA
jgi:hypothetical protein